MKEAWEVPPQYPFGADALVPLRAGARLGWRLAPPQAAP
jgi:dihydroorotase